MSAFLRGALARGLARALGTPPYLILFVSDACWTRCRHCWYTDAWKREHLRTAPLSFAELERMAASLRWVAFLSLTGGEAFRRDDLVELGAMFARRTRLGRYQIPTSGFEPDTVARATERLLRINPRTPLRIDVSLDGPPETHDAIRGVPGSFHRAVATVGELRRLKERHAHLDVGIITTVSRLNRDRLAETAAVVERVLPEGEWMVNVVRGQTRDPAAAGVGADEYFAAHRRIEERIARGAYRGHGGHAGARWLSAKNAVRRRVIRGILAGESAGGGCAAGSLGGVVDLHGGVWPCEMLERPMGHLRDFDGNLRRLWNSPRADAVRSYIQQSHCLCTQECFLSVSLLIQPRHWPAIVAERLRLMRGARRAGRRDGEGRP